MLTPPKSHTVHATSCMQSRHQLTMLALQEMVGSPVIWSILKIKERGQNNGMLVGGGRGYWLLFAAAEKRCAFVSVLAGACDGRIAFP
mmetsp:Transcript_33353/g.58527  ORF Transcript_33353/g.58527 Transcript_33353/m.58527 type:complete len:88 (-) Transcript_33353:123-386(-)